MDLLHEEEEALQNMEHEKRHRQGRKFSEKLDTKHGKQQQNEKQKQPHQVARTEAAKTATLDDAVESDFGLTNHQHWMDLDQKLENKEGVQSHLREEEEEDYLNSATGERIFRGGSCFVGRSSIIRRGGLGYSYSNIYANGGPNNLKPFLDRL